MAGVEEHSCQLPATAPERQQLQWQQLRRQQLPLATGHQWKRAQHQTEPRRLQEGCHQMLSERLMAPAPWASCPKASAGW